MIDSSLLLTDIHRCLDGNIRAQTILGFDREFNTILSTPILDTLCPHVQITSLEPDLIGFPVELDWGVEILASLETCRRIAYENVEDAVRNSLHYVELYFSSRYMTMTHQPSVDGVVEAMIAGVRKGSCDLQVDARLIGILSRTFGEAACQEELAVLLAYRGGIIALDLAGDELDFPGTLFPNHFNQVHGADRYITVHAGEATGLESIWQAIRELGAEYTSHGVKAVKGPALMDYLTEHQTDVESCLILNVQTSTVASLAQHSLKWLLEHGVLASLNTDDPAVQGVDIIHEYTIAAPVASLSGELIRQTQTNGLAQAFLNEQEKASPTQRATRG